MKATGGRVCWIHMHIPKCAGTSIQQMMARLSPRCVVYGTMEYPIEMRRVTENIALSEPDFVTGHIPYGIHEHVRHAEARYISIFRDPAERVWSYISHNLREGKDFWRLISEGMEPIGAMEALRPPSSCNLATRMILSTDKPHLTIADANVAFSRLKEEFYFVGRFDCLASAVQRLLQLVGHSGASLPWENKGSGAPLGDRDRARLYALDEADLHLWKRITLELDQDGNGWTRAS